MEQAQIVFDLFLPADQHSAKPVHPTVCALYYPSSRLEADLPFEGLCFFLSRSNMQSIAKYLPQFPNLVVVIPVLATLAYPFSKERSCWLSQFFFFALSQRDAMNVSHRKFPLSCENG